MRKPKAVLISDIHYNLQTLEVADAAMRQAISKSNHLAIPLIVAGDLTDSKAILRAECVNRMLETFILAQQHVIIVRGNHDAINEKSKEHSLNFLGHLATIVIEPTYNISGLTMIPYQSDTDVIKPFLDGSSAHAVTIMHQGVHSASPGHYFQDSTAIPKEWLEGRRVFSGHYHQHQDIECGETGLLTYIGNPYTLGYGEASDPEKGFLILYDDTSYDFVPTNLRKHIILDADSLEQLGYGRMNTNINKNDLVWVKFHITSAAIAHTIKAQFTEFLDLPCNFKLDLISTDQKAAACKIDTTILQDAAFDLLIDSYPDVDLERKTRLKSLWRSLV